MPVVGDVSTVALAGVVDGMPAADYHAHPALSSTQARALLSSPAQYRWQREHPRPPTREMELGTCVHSLLLGVGQDWVVIDSEDWTLTIDGDVENDRTAFQRIYHDLNGNDVFDRGIDTVDGDTVQAGCFVWHDAPGHNHWHFQEYARYVLRRIKDGTTGRVVADRDKVGFCMLDSSPIDLGLPGASDEPWYGGSRCNLDKPQGISVGWQDVYPFNLADQNIVVGSLPNGRYCLRVRLDPGSTDAPPPTGRILETDEADNIASTKLKLADDAVSELPGSC